MDLNIRAKETIKIEDIVITRLLSSLDFKRYIMLVNKSPLIIPPNKMFIPNSDDIAAAIIDA
jgi:hypothetical protein